MCLIISTLGALALAFVGAPVASADNSVTPLCNGQPCVGGWYTGPVFLGWSWTNGTATSGCASQYYADNTNQSGQPSSCTVSFLDGSGSTTRQYVLKIELGAPTVTATATRPPDANGWYNHPIAISFVGTAFSGIASCTPTAYNGPSATNVTVTGSCTDNAGKTAPAGLSFNYDDTPPTIIGATPARKPDANGYYTHPVKFVFTGTDATSGVAGCQTVTYGGPSSGSVVGGCWDRAGNYASVAVPVRYRRAGPGASAARNGSSIVLHWKRARGASYYNVQIYRAGQKVLSSWPARTGLRLRRTWTFAGHRFRLKPGRYRWYVWPGYGSRTRARYGRMLVTSTFRVLKRS